LVTKPENIFYLTSLAATNIALVINHKKNFAVTDFIYAEAATRSFKSLGIDIFVSNNKKTSGEIISSVLNKYRIRSLGVESQYMNLEDFRRLNRTLRRKSLISTRGLVESLREIKDTEEIRALKKAVKVTADTLKNVKSALHPSATEKEISRYTKEMFMKNGADELAFEPIIASQPYASQPHYVPKKVRIGTNKAILIDIGCKSEHYNSDLTRMCSLGKITSKFVKLYAILLDAQRRAIERIRPGVKICDIDLAARQHIENKGLGRFFGHNTGHGIGLEVHEMPVVSRSNKGLLKEGMVFTVEPGIYIPGYGGLRVEDVVRVTRKKHEILTDDIDKAI